jgi:2-polyprenyl-6-methoxyphenol hydroxylase-like FAD-dependent oxidoreductase
MTADRSDVVVVGAGPTGLVAACELARRGVVIRVIDKLPAPTGESRAIVVHARSLEMFDWMGIAGEIIDSGVKSQAMQMYAAGRRLARVEFGQVDSAFPFSVTIPQTETERILTERLHRLGVTTERGVELTALTQDADAAHLTLRHASGAQERADATWVIGADGSHSTVRAQVGTKLAGSFQGERFILGDVEAEHSLDLDSMYTYFSPDAGPLLAFPMRGTRMRLIAQIRDPDGQPPNLNPTQAELQRIVDARADGIKITESHWLTEFEVRHAQVPAYRFGRVFLAGDAAHVHSPAGGQGMNTGMQDAFNLGWKLAMAVYGTGGQQLLDSYHAERHPVAAKVIEFTTRLTQVGTLRHELAIKLRNELVHAAVGLAPIRHAIADQTEEVALSYRGSPVVAGRHHHGRVAAGDHAPHVADTDLQGQLSAAWSPEFGGHVIVTVSTAEPAGWPAPVRDAGDARQVLVTPAGGSPTDGYHLSVADPGHLVASRYGLRDGGRVIIRPDGYVGYIGDLAASVVPYFTRLQG